MSHHAKQLQQKTAHDHHVKDREFHIDDPVFVRNFTATGPTLLPGTITEVRSGLTVHVEMDDGRVFRGHINHICKCTRSISNHYTAEGTDDFLPPPITTSTTHDNPMADQSIPIANEPITTFRHSNRIRNPLD